MTNAQASAERQLEMYDELLADDTLPADQRARIGTARRNMWAFIVRMPPKRIK